MAGLNVIALISGGKDSFFSILHCRANGHHVIALANLYPPSRQGHAPVHDLESFMYQTVGHAVVPLYETALGLPLYRREIAGDAIVRSRDYGYAGDEDETEDLLSLLRSVMTAHPEANAVSTGAILSDYQRTRVESVALRLGLAPLSYLWQWPSLSTNTESSLLGDMEVVGQDSRIIKVASGGMDESFLWQNVADLRTRLRLVKAAQRFGTIGDGAVVGEGGEFETLVIDGPAPLWKGRIDVKPEHIHIVPGEAGSSSARISHASVVPKTGVPASEEPRIPPMLDGRFADIIEQTHTPIADMINPVCSPNLPSDPASVAGSTLLQSIIGIGSSVVEQTKAVMESVVSRLQAASLSIDQVTCSVITLRDMNDFAAVNEIYGSYFTRPNPPARITIACADVLPADSFLSITIIASEDSREGLHVQSRSYWAPANIGPYSQAIRTTRSPSDISIYVAGQIPLIPASMELPSSEFPAQSALALQHMHRIGQVMKVKTWVFGIAFIASSCVDTAALRHRASMARYTWRAYHQTPAVNDPEQDLDGDFDVWHAQYGSGKGAWQTNRSNDKCKDDRSLEIPPLAILAADSLPRGADIEWVGFGKGSHGHQSCVPPHLASLLHAFKSHMID